MELEFLGMGNFEALNSVAGATRQELETAVRGFLAKHGGSLVPSTTQDPDKDQLIIVDGPGGATVGFPSLFFGWEDSAEEISKTTGKPTFGFHIHDSDLWMYVLYVNGEVADRFNPVPDAWEEINEAEASKWKGSAETLVRYFPGLDPDQLRNYLVRWDDDLLDSDEQSKAYADDEYAIGEDWQLVDFMNRFGFQFFVDHPETLDMAIFDFKCPKFLI